MKYLIFMVSVIVVNFCSAYNNDPSQKTKEKMISKSFTEYNDIERVEPSHWWVGFKNQTLQLLVKDENVYTADIEISYEGVTIESIVKGTSPNYLFVDLKISEQTKPGKFNIYFKFENGSRKIQTYELKSRIKASEDYIGFNSSDVIYLITPDRFANGDESNDIIAYLKEKKIDRKNDYARHGGDIKGITNHLDYINEMGFTAIWPCPLLTNDMPRASYHGYAMTDFYQVDPRFGTLEEYKELADKARIFNIKLVMDQVVNHCGSEHWWMKDLPFSDWVNQQKAFEENTELKNSSHRRTINQDSYASERDKKEMSEGWFVEAMPDLNQNNPFMATYLIQNSIWWIETLGLGGIRQDTYPYSDKTFLADWTGAIMTEYPNFSIVGEEWSYNPLIVGYWQQGMNNKDGYKSRLKSPMDFPMQRQIVDALKEDEQWDTGFVKMYEGLANDFYYASPKDLMIFPDNHDMSRIFTQLNKDITKTKMALGYIFTLTRIVQFYYGTEILMNDSAKPGDHGLIRTDFPGGWQGDKVNAFTGEGLTITQKDMQLFVKKLLNYRKDSKAIIEGETIHFAPENGIYVLFRIIEDEIVAVILNKNKKLVKLNLERFDELGLKGRNLKNIITSEKVVWNDYLTLKGEGVIILTTK
ncbi:glycoside hydrolase family 13 protein [Gaetbulibacter aquiaggeris]|uniref:Glycoside hydrolase family 13 protein n=1 Tax=Gaetbulibacter aquiaggeris TaxID=1735373 RepID=A0ABW7MN68_9FLAO